MKLTREQQEQLFELCGMKHRSGSYTAEKWQEITGVNPKWFGEEYIRITKTGLCIWTAKAEKLYKAKSQKCFNDMAMLQGRSFYALKELF